MFLRITSPDWIIFEWSVNKATIPTESWEIWVLPWHIPLTSVVKPWIVKIYINEEHKDWFLNGKDFLFENGCINLSISKWLLFVDWESIIIATSAASSSPKESFEILSNMKSNLEHEIQQLRAKWSIEDLEKALMNLQKIDADLKLYKMKWIIK